MQCGVKGKGVKERSVWGRGGEEGGGRGVRFNDVKVK